ncbi:MAG TPA: tripartite tricarboxylate transporter TctB family protein [Gallionella sp.]|nr:tripartite tricarboxylate transporter TctB family protein [Gallionella sp.]
MHDHEEDRRQHGVATKKVKVERRQRGVYSERRQHRVPVKVDRRRHGVSTKAVEIAVSAITFGLGLVVIFDSRRVGYGWADDGPQAGYFPFYIGLILCAASAWSLLRAAFSKRSELGVFVSRRKLRMVMSVFTPSMIYVIAIYFIGIYVASALFIGAFMYWHGRFPWIKIIPVSLVVPVSMFVLFELWFLVPLPKGPLEALFGY